MRIRLILKFIILLVIITSCGAPKVLLVSDKQTAETATAEGNYAAAVQAWEQYFQKTPIENVMGIDFASAAKVAYKNGNSEQALSWFNEARYKNYSDLEMYNMLAEMARKQSNISKELTALEFIISNYPAQANVVNARLFEIYSEIKEPDKALIAWNNMAQNTKSEESNLIRYFNLKKSLNDTVVCDSVSEKLLEINPNQVDALEWNASKYYWKGENRYQNAMEEYNKNKTNKQYRILLKELETSTTDFKKALTYLEKLWNIEPGKKYASYFANIYARFGDEEKAKSYQKYLQ
jgi:tetratricopeptide (TPR) repeat protein